ncbi:hypothetical protein BDAP_000395 [Binucleata daphniae]
MRDLLKKRKKDSKENETVNADLIYMIKNNKNTKINKDITVDLLEFLLLKRFQKNGIAGGTKESKKSHVGVISIIFLILTGISVFIGYKTLKSGGGMPGKVASGEPYTVIKDVSKFGYLQLFGKDELLLQVAYEIVRMNNMIVNTEQSLLYKLLKPISKNVLLYGPPGTGKTLFVKKLAYVVDIEIKLRRELKKLGNKEFKKNVYTKEKLKKLPTGCVLITVQPSSLVDKYVGSTEKNIQSLFLKAQIESQHAPVLIFIDEIDVFFSERKESTAEHNVNTKTEFLCILDGMRTRLEDRIFLIGATNHQDRMDEAFVRRMGIQIFFDNPSCEERKEMLAMYMEGNDWRDEAKLNKLVGLTDGFSQNKITNAFQELIRKTCNMTGTFTYEEITKILITYRDKVSVKNLMPTDLNLTERQRREMRYRNIGN